MKLLRFCFVLCCFVPTAWGQVLFEEAVVDVGNVGLTVTNAGFVGRAGVRNNPTGDPSFEYPLDSGIEHLFEAGLWVGAVRRSDGTITVRTAAQTAATGYQPGATGYEFAQTAPFNSRSSLPESPVFTRSAVSHLDYLTAYVDTASVLPGTAIPMPDPAGQLGMKIEQTSYAWNFPFTEYFAIVNFDIINISNTAWDSVYVGMYHDLVVRNINTTSDGGGAFFNKNGIGFIDSLQTNYAFNAGGTEETLYTYGGISILGAEWRDPSTGQKRFFHPSVADEYIAEGLAPPEVNPRWWIFSGGLDEESRPSTDDEKYRRMATPFPNPDNFDSEPDFQQAFNQWRDRLRVGGQTSQGNWLGLTPIGPFPTVAAGDTLQVTFAFTAAFKPDEFQDATGQVLDNEETQAIFKNNIGWARRTYAGEDNNYNGRLDAGEDVNNNGVLDRYLIPEPPSSPNVRVEFEAATDPVTGQQDNRVALYWDRSSEESLDPVTGRRDFEGYRVYRSNPGDDRSGNILAQASLIAQYDRTGNRVGFNTGFNEIALSQPRTFDNDPNEYWYRLEIDDLLAGWQYLFTITAFDEGDLDAGLPSFESSRTANATRVFPGTPADETGTRRVGVYPNPYRVNAAWDGDTNRTRRLNFYNVPPRAEIRIYTLAGEVVKTLEHDASTYSGDIRWYDSFSADNRTLSGGEHSWDLLSDNGLSLSTGLYLYTVKDLDTDEVQSGKFVIIR